MNINTKCDLKFLVELLNPAEYVKSKVVLGVGVATWSLNQTSQGNSKHQQSRPWNNGKTEKQSANLSEKSILYGDCNTLIHVTTSLHSKMHGHLSPTDLDLSLEPCTELLGDLG